MTAFLESPVPTLAVGGLAAVFAIVVFLSRRSLGTLVGVAVVLAVIAGMLVVERMVVTDREEVEAAVASVLAAVEANDVEGIVRWIDPQRTQIVADARALAPTIVVEKARATGGITITVEKAAAASQAHSRFRAFLNGTLRQGGAPIGYFDDIEVDWENRGGAGWRITGYTAYYKGQPIDAVGSARGNRPVPAP